MADIKQFLDFPGLAEYDRLIKEYIDNKTPSELTQMVADLAAAQESIQDNADAIEKLNGGSEVEGSVANKIDAALTELVNGAPQTLDTLKEIADWIANDETGTQALINRVSDVEDAVEEIQSQNENLKEYVDGQDQSFYNSIQAIDRLKVEALFPVAQNADESAAEAISGVTEGKAVKLLADQNIAENITIEKSCYIDANGSTFEGTVTVPADADVIIENATFANPVVIA